MSVALGRYGRRSKYGAKPAWVLPSLQILRAPEGPFKYVRHWIEQIKGAGGIRFASTGEAQRYVDLRLLEKGGHISELRTQVKFPIYVNGHIVFNYVADFVYREGDRQVIDDFKGKETPEFKLKWKCMKAQHHTDYELRISK